MSLILNELESCRFGVQCAKINCLETVFPDLKEIHRSAIGLGISMISTRVDADALDRVHRLEENGYRLMDTLVYYGRSLNNPDKPDQLPEDISIRLATPEDAPAVAHVAARGFKGYFGHYHADPRLDGRAADMAYVQWATTSVERTDQNTPVLLALVSGVVAGFVTLRFNSSEEAEIVLNAVDPDHQRRGIYGQLLERMINLCAERNAQKLIISTQINNYSVQRVWGRFGFTLQKGLYTFHKWLD